MTLEAYTTTELKEIEGEMQLLQSIS